MFGKDSNITFKTLIEFLMKDKLELRKKGVPQKHKLTNQKRLYWKLEDGWLTLYGL